MPRIPLFAFLASWLWMTAATPVMAQDAGSAAPSNQPKVKVNMLNVCTPSADEQKEIAAALARIPKQPLFDNDFEVTRGRSTLTDMPAMLQVGQAGHVAGEPSIANYVRIRREFSVQAMFSSVQYSFSNDGSQIVETLVLHVREPKDLIEVSLDDSASAVASAEAMLTANNAASRIRLERFGKSSVVLARCLGNPGGPPPDQSAYEPLFSGASGVLANYRNLMGVKRIVPEELSLMPNGAKAESKTALKTKPAHAKPAPDK